MKILRLLMLTSSALIACCSDCKVVDLKSGSAECFNDIVLNLSNAATNPSDKATFEDSVCKMILAVINLVGEAYQNGINLSKDECNKIINGMTKEEKDALLTMLTESSVLRSTDTNDTQDSSCCKCKNNCCGSSSSSSCCCKSVSTDSNTETQDSSCCKCKNNCCGSSSSSSCCCKSVSTDSNTETQDSSCCKCKNNCCGSSSSSSCCCKSVNTDSTECTGDACPIR